MVICLSKVRISRIDIPIGAWKCSLNFVTVCSVIIMGCKMACGQAWKVCQIQVYNMYLRLLIDTLEVKASLYEINSEICLHAFMLVYIYTYAWHTLIHYVEIVKV